MIHFASKQQSRGALNLAALKMLPNVSVKYLKNVFKGALFELASLQPVNYCVSVSQEFGFLFENSYF